MQRVVTALLVACYGIAWACSFTQPLRGIIFLLIMTGLITIPYFIVRMSLMVIVVTSLIAVLVVFFPLAAPFLLVFGILTKFYALVRKLPLILGGSALYLLLLLMPHAVNANSFLTEIELHSAWSGTLVSGIIGTLTILLMLYWFEKLGYNRCRAALGMLGFGWFLMLFVLTFLLPGNFDGGMDLSGDS